MLALSLTISPSHTPTPVLPTMVPYLEFLVNEMNFDGLYVYLIEPKHSHQRSHLLTLRALVSPARSIFLAGETEWIAMAARRVDGVGLVVIETAEALGRLVLGCFRARLVSCFLLDPFDEFENGLGGLFGLLLVLELHLAVELQEGLEVLLLFFDCATGLVNGTVFATPQEEVQPIVFLADIPHIFLGTKHTRARMLDECFVTGVVH